MYKQEIQGKQEYQIAAKLIERLSEAFSIDIPEDEIGYITMHLMGAKLRENQSYLLEETSIDLAHRAKSLSARWENSCILIYREITGF